MNNEYSPLENFLNAPMIDYYRKHPEEFMEEMFLFIDPKKKKKEQQLVRELWASIDPNGEARKNEDKLDLNEILSSKFAFS